MIRLSDVGGLSAAWAGTDVVQDLIGINSLSMGSCKMRHIKELDGLRFLAITGVLATHYQPPFRPKLDFMAIGWVGVDLFFVLSGFLITNVLVSLRATIQPYRTFYWRRALRIFPVFYVVLFTLWGIALLIHEPDPGLTKFMLKQLFFLGSVLTSEGSRAVQTLTSHGLPINLPSPIEHHIFSTYFIGMGIVWSVSIEEFFYLLWAPVVLRCNRRQVIVIASATLVLCPLIRLITHRQDFREYFFLFGRLDSLTIGSLLAMLFIAHERGEVDERTLSVGLKLGGAAACALLVWLCLACGILLHFDVRSSLSFAFIGYTLLGLMFASLVGLCVLHADSRVWWARLLRSSPLVYVGTISYAVYLIHIPVVVTLCKVYSRIEGRTFTPTLPTALLSTGITLLIAGISWRYFEKPILRYKDAFFKPQMARLF